jgi:uncharacterized protein (DUF1697 family)
MEMKKNFACGMMTSYSYEKGLVMGKQIAFLRAINVGGRRIKMDALKILFEEVGLLNVQTFLASGNVVFDTAGEEPSSLEAMLEQVIFKTFGFESQVMVRSIEAIQAVQKYEAFPGADIEKAGAYNVAFLKNKISAEAQEKLMTLQNEVDRFHVHGTEVYWLCTVKQSESKFSNVVLEKTGKIASTMRGMSTLDKLIKKFA